MRYKCDIDGCDFECEDYPLNCCSGGSKLIRHFEAKHKDKLTEYIVSYLKSINLNPVTKCIVCNNNIKINHISRWYGIQSILPLLTGICSNKCADELVSKLIWKYEPCHGNNLQCLYERRDTWDEPESTILSKPRKIRKCSLETKIKISNSISKAVTEGRLNPKFKLIPEICKRPIENISDWIKLCKSRLRNFESCDEMNFRKKLELITKNIGTQIYFNLGLKWRFLDYFIFYKFHKINIEIDGDPYHKISNDLIRDKLLYEKYKILTLRINNIASRKMSIDQLINSIDDLINNGPYWNRYSNEADIYDWKWLVHYGCYESCKNKLT